MAELLGMLSQARGVLLTTHKDPDGDGFSCALAMQELLKARGVPSLTVTQTVPRFLEFLPGASAVCHTVPADFIYTLVLALDCSRQERLWLLPGLSLEGRMLVNVDHHMDNSNYGQFNLVDDAAATGEMIFPLWQQAGVPLNQAAATCIYTAVFTDTGGFRYSNTSARTFEVAQACVRAGAPVAEVALCAYGSRTRADFEMLGATLSSLETHADGKVVSAVIDADRYGESAREAIDFIRDLDTAEVAVAFRSYHSQGYVKVNLRSKRFFNVQQVAQHFGGGGHVRASGVEIPGFVEAVKPKVIDEIVRRFA